MTAHILVVDDEPDVEALVLQKFRHKIEVGRSASCSRATALKPWRR